MSIGVVGDQNKCFNDECRLSWGYKGLVVRPMENGLTSPCMALNGYGGGGKEYIKWVCGHYTGDVHMMITTIHISFIYFFTF